MQWVARESIQPNAERALTPITGGSIAGLMAQSDNLFETLRDLIVASIPGLVTKDDLAQVEQRLGELEELLDELEDRLGQERD